MTTELSILPYIQYAASAGCDLDDLTKTRNLNLVLTTTRDYRILSLAFQYANRTQQYGALDMVIIELIYQRAYFCVVKNRLEITIPPLMTKAEIDLKFVDFSYDDYRALKLAIRSNNRYLMKVLLDCIPKPLSLPSVVDAMQSDDHGLFEYLIQCGVDVSSNQILERLTARNFEFCKKIAEPIVYRREFIESTRQRILGSRDEVTESEIDKLVSEYLNDEDLQFFLVHAIRIQQSGLYDQLIRVALQRNLVLIFLQKCTEFQRLEMITKITHHYTPSEPDSGTHLLNFTISAGKYVHWFVNPTYHPSDAFRDSMKNYGWKPSVLCHLREYARHCALNYNYLLVKGAIEYAMEHGIHGAIDSVIAVLISQKADLIKEDGWLVIRLPTRVITYRIPIHLIDFTYDANRILGATISSTIRSTIQFISTKLTTPITLPSLGENMPSDDVELLEFVVSQGVECTDNIDGFNERGFKKCAKFAIDRLFSFAEFICSRLKKGDYQFQPADTQIIQNPHLDKESLRNLIDEVIRWYNPKLYTVIIETVFRRGIFRLQQRVYLRAITSENKEALTKIVSLHTKPSEVADTVYGLIYGRSPLDIYTHRWPNTPDYVRAQRQRR